MRSFEPMKNMKTICLIIATVSLAIFPSPNIAHADATACIYSNIQTAVSAVKIVEATDIAVLHAERGQDEFTQRYGIAFPPNMTWQSNSLYLVVLTPPHIGIDRVARYRRNEITIDLFDTGIDVEMIAPPEGTSWMVSHLLQIEGATASSEITIRKPVTTKRLDFGN